MQGHAHPPAPTADRCPLERPRPDQSREALRRRAKAVRRVFWITLGLNLLVALAKGAYSYLSGSVTLSADTFHSLLDASSNVIALVGLRLSASPADAGHPYGHRKFETLASLGIGVLIAVSLIELARQSWRALEGARPPPDISWVGFAIVLATIVINGFVSTYERNEGQRLASPLLVADAHHTRSDMYASAAVLLSFVGAEIGLRWADGVGGLIVSFMVGKVAWNVFRENVPFLVDAAVIDPTQVRQLGAGVVGCLNIHQVRSRGTRFAMELDLHLEVDPSMTVDRAHSVAHALEDELRREMPYLADVVVHVEPGRKGASPGGPRPAPQAQRPDFRENTGQHDRHDESGTDRGKRPKQRTE
jgi:cation diffusion facilitator family transporter